jgi:hypothetical protein
VFCVDFKTCTIFSFNIITHNFTPPKSPHFCFMLSFTNTINNSAEFWLLLETCVGEMYTELHYLNSFQHIKSKNKKGKGRVVPRATCHADVWGSGGIAPCILNTGTRWKWSTLCPGHFTPMERTPVPNGQKLIGTQSWSEWCGEEKNLALLGFKPWLSIP